ncbi:MAG: hypothetical protein V4580_18175 [Bacteroidota bacterium]
MTKKAENIGIDCEKSENKGASTFVKAFYDNFLKEKALTAREDKIFADSMKEITGGKGFILSNAK